MLTPASRLLRDECWRLIDLNSELTAEGDKIVSHRIDEDSLVRLVEINWQLKEHCDQIQAFCRIEEECPG